MTGALPSGGYTNNHTFNPVVSIVPMWWMTLRQVGHEWYLMGTGNTYQYNSDAESRATQDGLTTLALNYNFMGDIDQNNQFKATTLCGNANVTVVMQVM